MNLLNYTIAVDKKNKVKNACCQNYSLKLRSRDLAYIPIFFAN